MMRFTFVLALLALAHISFGQTETPPKNAEAPAQTAPNNDAKGVPSAPPMYMVPPPPPPPRENVIYNVVEEMPRFPGCEDDVATLDEKKACAQQLLLDYIYTNLTYPEAAKLAELEGTAVVTFTIEKDGTATGIRVVREIGGGCGQAAMDVIELMNLEGIKWIPGKQGGQPVRVQFNLPVKFKLEG